MIDWKVLEDSPLPESREEEPRPRGTGWRWWLGGLLALLLLVGLGLWWRVRTAEAELRRDLEQVVAVEERAISFGHVQQARALADPAARAEWRDWYASLFVPTSGEPPVARIGEIEYDGATVLATLHYQTERRAWQEVRAYRWVGSEWRRTPVPFERWGDSVAYESEHFALWMSARDAAHLPPDELLAELERFHEAFLSHWPSISRNPPITIRIEPHEQGSTPATITNQITLRSPLLSTPAAPDGLLAPERAYHLALMQAVAASFDYWQIAELEESLLRPALREALVRRLVLTEEEQRRSWGRTLLREDDDASLLSESTRALVADYLLATYGPDAAEALLTAYATLDDLEAAVQESTGHSWPFLVYNARRWPLAPVALEAGGTGSGRLVGIEDKRWLIETGGQTIRARLATGVDLPVPSDCLPTLDEISFHIAAADGAEWVLDDVQVVSRDLSSWRMSPMPTNTRVLFTRQKGNAMELLALDALERETWLGTLPTIIEPTTHATEPRFAFLLEGPCGTSLNRYDPETGIIHRTALAMPGARRLAWVQNTLYLITQQGALPGAQGWQVYEVVERVEEVALRLIAANEGQLVGYSRITGRFLLQDSALRLAWAEAAESVPPRSSLLDIPTNIEIGALSHDGRWLAYTIHGAFGESELRALDLLTGFEQFLDNLKPNLAHGEMAWSFGEVPLLTVVRGDLGAMPPQGNQLLRYQLATPTNSLLTEVAQTDGEVDHLHWCASNQFLYRVVRGERHVLMEGFGALARTLTPGDEVLWCRGP